MIVSLRDLLCVKPSVMKRTNVMKRRNAMKRKNAIKEWEVIKEDGDKKKHWRKM